LKRVQAFKKIISKNWQKNGNMISIHILMRSLFREDELPFKYGFLITNNEAPL